MTADELIKLLDLTPHPEGGFYRETYRSRGKIPKALLPKDFSGDCAYATAIYYLLIPGAVSRFHRLKTEEVFHFYLGDPITWVILHPSGQKEQVTLGPSIQHGHHLQFVVPAGVWFGGYLNDGGKFGLMGATVSPGFEFVDFEVANRETLLKQHPAFRKEIERLT